MTSPPPPLPLPPGPEPRPAGGYSPPPAVGVPQAPPSGPSGGGLVWLRVHPVTPLVRGWRVLLVILVIVGQQVGSMGTSGATEALTLLGMGPVLGALGLVVLIGFAYSFLAWRVTRYAVDDETVYLHTGVLFRQQRSARLDRIQGIDTVQPLLARIFGLAELKIEVAGGRDSAVRLAFLREHEAQALRNELLAKAAGVVNRSRSQTPGLPGMPAAGSTGAPEGAAPERELVAVSPVRLIGSLVMSGAMIWAVASLVLVVVVAIASRTWGVIFGVLPFAAGAVGYVWTRFSSEFNFRLAQSPDGIRLRHGLVEARAQTLPPGRVQAVRLTQPLLWRSKDWWRVEVNVAGYVQQDNKASETVLLPVGTRAEALLAVWLVVPDLGVADPQATFDVAMVGSGPGGGVVASPRAAAWFDLLAWRRNGYLVTQRALLIRSGVVTRSLVMVPHERTQSVGMNQGVLQRALKVATVRAHSTPGPISPTVPHLTEADAAEFVRAQVVRARLARAAAGPEQWMKRPEAAAAPTGTTSAPPPMAVSPPPPPPGPSAPPVRQQTDDQGFGR